MNPIKHVAIIMDGNGRWGEKNKKSRNLGHKEGLKTVELAMKECIKNKIKFLTLYAFSTENWKRPLSERKYLFSLLETYLRDKLETLNKEQIKIKIFGKLNFSKKLNKLLNYAEKKTKNNKKLQVNLALNYGSKSEIVSAIKKIGKKKTINIYNIEKNLYSRNIPDPEILIRTGNTHRLSNFMLWQIAYTEIFFEKKLWPDFKSVDFNKILKKFKKIKRNFGDI
ncbi:polyprenyl diphosphate synthase [Candidatus Pelagibacter communis]|uniref:polyprenyl diphosphate synthase n=1 Tax=Pelagibacter ubique TaxID=198252 RepID=UPI00094C0C66|nr:polyprenyl diphosphate synthase [Candidatus Pelagibacter ubique]